MVHRKRKRDNNNSSRCTTANEQDDAFSCSPLSYSLVLFFSGFQNLRIYREAQRSKVNELA